MSGYSSKNTSEFRSLLSARRLELLSQVEARLAEAREEHIGPDASAPTAGGDEASLDLASEIDLAIAGRDVEELRDIEAALERLADGTFGACTSCGEAIILERLRAYPTAKRCAACQDRFERTRGGAQPARL